MRYDWKQVPGYFEEDEGLLAQEICKDKVVLEIGALNGRSTCCISDVAKSILTIDIFTGDLGGYAQDGPPEGLQWFLTYTKGRDNITYTVGKSEHVVPSLADNSFDVALIDGIHAEKFIRQDILNCYPKLKKDGLFLIHDYFDDPGKWPDVKRITDELFLITKLVARAGSLVVIGKEAFK